MIREEEDIFYLTFQELHDAVRTGQSLTPPRVLTSEGEAISGAYRRDDLPARNVKTTRRADTTLAP